MIELENKIIFYIVSLGKKLVERKENRNIWFLEVVGRKVLICNC